MAAAYGAVLLVKQLFVRFCRPHVSSGNRMAAAWASGSSPRSLPLPPDDLAHVREHVEEVNYEDESRHHVVVLGDAVPLLLQDHLRVDGHEDYRCEHKDAAEGDVDYVALLELGEDDGEGQSGCQKGCAYTALDANVPSGCQAVQSHAGKGAGCNQEHHEDALRSVRPAGLGKNVALAQGCRQQDEIVRGLAPRQLPPSQQAHITDHVAAKCDPEQVEVLCLHLHEAWTVGTEANQAGREDHLGREYEVNSSYELVCVILLHQVDVLEVVLDAIGIIDNVVAVDVRPVQADASSGTAALAGCVEVRACLRAASSSSHLHLLPAALGLIVIDLVLVHSLLATWRSLPLLEHLRTWKYIETFIFV